LSRLSVCLSACLSGCLVSLFSLSLRLVYLSSCLSVTPSYPFTKLRPVLAPEGACVAVGLCHAPADFNLTEFVSCRVLLCVAAAPPSVLLCACVAVGLCHAPANFNLTNFVRYCVLLSVAAAPPSVCSCLCCCRPLPRPRPQPHRLCAFLLPILLCIAAAPSVCSCLSCCRPRTR
jgi:hypothetical protein